MNEIKAYLKMMKKAMSRTRPNEYCEHHHIWPVSIYGKNDSQVWLTAKEHYIAHMLLAAAAKKRYGQTHWKTRKLAHAWNMMTIISDAQCDKRHTSASFDRARKALSLAKTGVERKDMKGKKYFGASEETISAGIEKMRVAKTGLKIDYPQNRKSAPCSAEKAQKISDVRKKTVDKYVQMSYDEFIQWMSAFNMYRKDGRPNPNITRAIVARGEAIEQYYEVKNGLDSTV